MNMILTKTNITMFLIALATIYIANNTTFGKDYLGGGKGWL